jgi:hypothetical protein
MTILMSISEGVGGVSGNVCNRNINQLYVVLCKETVFKAVGGAVKVVMCGSSRTERLAR